MPLSPLAAREKKNRRGRATPNAVVAGNLQLVADSGVADRPLSLEEARDLAAARPVATRSEFRPSTLKKNRQFLKKYVTVNARDDVDETGLESLLQALFVQQSHILGRGVRAMTAESMVDNICRVGARMRRSRTRAPPSPAPFRACFSATSAAPTWSSRGASGRSSSTTRPPSFSWPRSPVSTKFFFPVP